MSTLMKFGIVPSALLLFFATSVTAAVDPLPPGEYACQVETRSGAAGLVLLQANSKKEAAAAAIGLQAYTSAEGTGTAVEVTQCIVQRKERFSDGAFQEFFENLPL